MTQQEPQNNPSTTDFGFTKIPREEKKARVRDVFERSANRYDMMNDIMSAGLHRLWKSHLINRLPLHQALRPLAMLDVAGGTGDIAFRALQTKAGIAGCLNMTLLDINEDMLAVGRTNAAQRGVSDDISFLAGDAENLPFEDQSMDIYTISFGIRNVTDRAQALREARRVLKPGGVFACLEFSQLPLKFMQRAYDAYSFTFIPAFGRVISGDAAPYKYLVESIRTFPNADHFADEVKEAGFARVRFDRLSQGIVALHLGWRPSP